MTTTYDSTSNYEALTVDNMSVGILTTPTIVTGTITASGAITGGTITGGTVTSGLGTAAAPSYTFTGRTDTGVFSGAAGTVSISSAGTDTLDINSALTTLRSPLTLSSNPILGVVSNISAASATPRSYVDSVGCLYWTANSLPTATASLTYVPMVAVGTSWFSDGNWSVVASPPSITYVGTLARIYTCNFSASGIAATTMTVLMGVFQNAGLIVPSVSSTILSTVPTSMSTSVPLLVSPGDVFVPRINMQTGASPAIIGYMTLTFN